MAAARYELRGFEQPHVSPGANRMVLFSKLSSKAKLTAALEVAQGRDDLGTIEWRLVPPDQKPERRYDPKYGWQNATSYVVPAAKAKKGK